MSETPETACKNLFYWPDESEKRAFVATYKNSHCADNFILFYNRRDILPLFVNAQNMLVADTEEARWLKLRMWNMVGMVSTRAMEAGWYPISSSYVWDFQGNEVIGWSYDSVAPVETNMALVSQVLKSLVLPDRLEQAVRWAPWFSDPYTACKLLEEDF